VIWPEKGHIFDSAKCQVDHMLSLGTGSSVPSKHAIGPHSPRKERFYKRCFGVLMIHMDAEQQWATFYQCVPPEIRTRLHRLNISLPGAEPAIDDVAAMHGLKSAALEYVQSEAQVVLVQNSMIASMFYLELDQIETLEGGARHCQGTIFCRTPLDVSRRKDLYQALLKKHAMFVVNGNSLPCVETIPRGMPIFRRQVKFVLKDESSLVHIVITGITSEPTSISGLPIKMDKLAKAQGLNAPFGCIDHRVTSRELPVIPLKRKANGI
jgi:hypothetical protein